MFNYLRNWQTILQSSCAFTFSPVTCEGSNWFTSSPLLVTVGHFNCSPSRVCQVVPHGFVSLMFNNVEIFSSVYYWAFVVSSLEKEEKISL